MKKKLVVGAAAVALGALLAVGGTLAWFTDTETAANVITTGKVDITLTEEAAAPTGGSVAENSNNGYTYEGVTPGTVLVKKPTVTVANDSNSAYVRVAVEATTTAGSLDKMIFQLDGAEVEPVVEGGKYYFYCDTTLAADGTYVPFNQVSFPGDKFGNEFANATIDMTVTAEAIQADNMDVQGKTGVEATKTAFNGQTIAALETQAP